MTERILVALYLIVGLFVVFLCVGPEPGVYSGEYNAEFHIHGDRFSSSLRVHAKTKPQWYWARPQKHQYSDADLETWGDSDQQATLNLSAGTLELHSVRSPLDVDRLARFVAPHVKTKGRDELRAQVNAVLPFLYGLRDGTAPRPRHHMYCVDSPVRATILHSTAGENYGVFAAFAWISIWPLLLLAMKSKAFFGLRGARMAYLATLASITMIDAALICVGMMFSPGPVSELVEVFLALANLPAWTMFGERLVLSWLGLAFGALCWAGLVSMTVLMKNWSVTNGCNRAAVASSGVDCQPVAAD